MSKIRASNIKLSISKDKFTAAIDSDEFEAPTEGELVPLECAITNFGWDFGSAEEEDTTPLCEAEARHTSYSLRGKGTITMDMFFEPKSAAYKSVIASNTDLMTRYIKVEYLDDEKVVVLTREVLGTVESVNETAEVGNHVRASISIGTSGKVKPTDGKVGA